MGKEIKVTNPLLNNPAMKFIGKETIEKVDGSVGPIEPAAPPEEPTEVPAHSAAPVVEETKRRPGRPKVTTKKKQYTVTLKKELYDEAMLAAERMGISFSALATNALNEYLNK